MADSPKIALGVYHFLATSPRDKINRIISIVEGEIERAHKLGCKKAAIEMTPWMLDAASASGIDRKKFVQNVLKIYPGTEKDIFDPHLSVFMHAAVKALSLGMEVVPLDSTFSSTRTSRIMYEMQAYDKVGNMLEGSGSNPRAEALKRQVGTRMAELAAKKEIVREKATDKRFLRKTLESSSDLLIIGLGHHQRLMPRLNGFEPRIARL